jgi:hypothetical protein
VTFRDSAPDGAAQTSPEASMNNFMIFIVCEMQERRMRQETGKP